METGACGSVRDRVIRPESPWLISPSRSDSSMRWVSWSRLCTEVSSSRGVTRQSLTRPLLIQFISRISGRTALTRARKAGLSSIAERSGWAMAQDLGAISPTTMCRKTTTIMASAKAMP
ncbi:hypothetical protein GA0115255_107494 [Streptomyces sp. Ncost-T6T-2b]|nr:hypothetical protein GA0115255_107494 [Streptomyces sp. Ncost-T6T-2b]